MGKFLFVGLIMLIVAAFANIFLQLPGLMIAISVIAIGIFSAFLLYDLNRIMTGGETNYITATLAVYLDVFNVFQNLLRCWASSAANATDAFSLPQRAASAALFLGGSRMRKADPQMNADAAMNQ